jgi:hypothetical protein
MALIRMRPSFNGARQYIKITLKETRGYGFNLYLARISGLASSRSDQLAIGYFLPSTTPLGMYAIAQKFSNPISMAGRSLATTRFPRFHRLTRVPARITKWNTLAVVGASFALVVAGPIVLRLVFPKYSEAASLLIPFAAMNLFVGLFQPYNIFLAAHGRGAELRNIVLICGAATILRLCLPSHVLASPALRGQSQLRWRWTTYCTFSTIESSFAPWTGAISEMPVRAGLLARPLCDRLNEGRARRPARTGLKSATWINSLITASLESL